MSQTFTLHTHTNLFDGKNTVAEMANVAHDQGMTAIGISNHFIVHPDIKNSNFYQFAVRGGYADMYQSSFPGVFEKYRPHYDEIERMSLRLRMPILRGIEVDYFHNTAWRHAFEYAIKTLNPDYIIGACHFIEYNGRLCNVHDIANAPRAEQDKMLGLYWAKVAQAASSGLFTFMAHLDLPRKVGLGTSAKWHDIETHVIDVLAQNKMPIEINTGGFSTIGHPYPAPHILRHVASAGIPVVISDDAHNVNQIGRHFDDAEKLIKSYGIKNRLSLQKILDFSQKTL